MVTFMVMLRDLLSTQTGAENGFSLELPLGFRSSDIQLQTDWSQSAAALNIHTDICPNTQYLPPWITDSLCLMQITGVLNHLWPRHTFLQNVNEPL